MKNIRIQNLFVFQLSIIVDQLLLSKIFLTIIPLRNMLYQLLSILQNKSNDACNKSYLIYPSDVHAQSQWATTIW